MTKTHKHHLVWFMVCFLLVVFGGGVSYTLYKKLMKSNEVVHEINLNYQALYSRSDEAKLTRMIMELQPTTEHFKMLEYKAAILQASQKWSVPPLLIASMVMRESSFKPNKIGSKLPSGTRCLGPMQIHPGAHKDKLAARHIKPRDLQDVTINIDVGAEVLREYLDRFDWNIKKSLIAYVGGKHLDYVNDVLSCYVKFDA